MRTRLVSFAALAAGLALAVPSADAAAVTVKDVAGDANSLNTQGANVPGVPQNTATPGSQAAWDILSVTFDAVRKGKTATGLRVTVQFAAKPDETATVHRVTAADAGGCSTFSIQYYAEHSAQGGKTAALRTCDEAAALGYSDFPIPLPKVVESSLIFEIPFTALKPAGLKAGSVLTGLGAHNRIVTVVTAPQIDQVLDSAATYKLGS